MDFAGTKTPNSAFYRSFFPLTVAEDLRPVSSPTFQGLGLGLRWQWLRLETRTWTSWLGTWTRSKTRLGLKLAGIAFFQHKRNIQNKHFRIFLSPNCQINLLFPRRTFQLVYGWFAILRINRRIFIFGAKSPHCITVKSNLLLYNPSITIYPLLCM